MKYEKTGNYENDMRYQKADNDGKYSKLVKAFAWLYALKNLDKIIINIILAVVLILGLVIMAVDWITK
jgi:hypothetical protein